MAFIRKYISDPWLKYIEEGYKIYEGKINKPNGWSDIKMGEEITLWNDERTCNVKIISKLYYTNFGEAWHELKDKLLPNCKDIDEAINIYQNFYKNEDIEKYGVVCYQLKLVE